MPLDPRLGELLRLPGNAKCADCPEKAPRWCSVTIGVLICEECAGIHRKLGTHLSFVQSATLDTWKDAWLEKLAAVGNARAAETYEALLPRDWPPLRVESLGGDRIAGESARHLELFIRAKYEHKLFARRAEAPASGSLQVLLRRGSGGQEPFGLKPQRGALSRGVLQVATVTPDSPAARWNDAQEHPALCLSAGDCLLSVNGVPPQRGDCCAAVLEQLVQQPQVLLSVRRPPPVDAVPSYKGLLQQAYCLFNPGKLGEELGQLLAKHAGNERELFLRVCGKYALNQDDWRELLHCLSERGLLPEGDLPRVESELLGAKGRELHLLEAACRRYVDRALEEDKGAELRCRLARQEHWQWPQTQLLLRRETPSSPLGIRQDKAALRELGLFVVREVVAGFPAAAAGLRQGDVLETIAGEDALVVAGQGTPAGCGVEVPLTLRRPP